MKINKKSIIPITFGAALVITLGYFLYKSIKTPAPTPSPTPTPPQEIDEVIDNGQYNGDLFTVTTRSGTRLRSEASTDSSIIKTYNSGYEMLVIGQQNKSDGLWYKVQDPSTQIIGYMRSDVVNK